MVTQSKYLWCQCLFSSHLLTVMIFFLVKGFLFWFGFFSHLYQRKFLFRLSAELLFCLNFWGKFLNACDEWAGKKVLWLLMPWVVCKANVFSLEMWWAALETIHAAFSCWFKKTISKLYSKCLTSLFQLRWSIMSISFFRKLTASNGLFK